MAKNTYYEDELRYLRDVGPEFARVNPDLASRLSDPGSDPDVERLLEGVAFLCGRIREKLDDELPELTASMMSLLWPHYLRPIPSMTILELLPDIDGMQAAQAVNEAAEFASTPIDGTKCLYRSAWPVVLRPWTIGDVRLETDPARPMRLVITLQTAAKAKLENILVTKPDPSMANLRLFLAGDPAAAFSLYLLMTAELRDLTVSDGSSRHDRRELKLPPASVAAAGFDRAEAVLPYPSRSFAGYRLLQEYFAFKHRFLFVDINRLDRAVAQLGLTTTMELAFTFKRHLDPPPIISRENLRLHCVPIINLFRHAANPVRVQQDRVQYLVQPARSGIADWRHAEVYSIDGVHGLVRGEALESRDYKPFYSFAHMTDGDPRSATYYQDFRVPSVVENDPRYGTDTYISFVSGGKTGAMPPEETISIDLTCTNRHLPSVIRANEIREPTDRSPPGIRFRNIYTPTPTISPPLRNQLHWRLISHMSLNFVSLADADRLKELLKVYDFQSPQDAQRERALQRTLEGILKLRCRFREMIFRGAPKRGVQIDLTLDEHCFAGEGDAYLFSTLLDRFFGLYVTVNSYSRLIVHFHRSGETYRFVPRAGERITPADTMHDDDEGAR